MKRIYVGVLFLFSFFSLAQKKYWSLDECITYAKEQNINVLEALLEEKKTSYDVLKAKMAFLPGFQMRYRKNFEQHQSGKAHANYFIIESTLPLLDGLKRIHLIKKNHINKSIYQAQREQVGLELETSIVKNFIEILHGKENLKVALEQLEISKHIRDHIKRKYEMGILSKRDLSNTEAQWALSEKDFLIAQNELAMNKLQLSLLLELKNNQEFDVYQEEFSIDFIGGLDMNLEELEEKTAKLRPELRKAELYYEMQKKEFLIQKADLWPTMSLYASLENNLTQSYSYLEGKKEIGLLLTWSIFDSYSSKVSIEKAFIDQQKAHLGIKKVRNELREALFQAYMNMKNSYSIYQAALKEEHASKASFDYARLSYEEGLINSYEYNNTKNQWLQAQLKAIKTKYECFLYVKMLELYVGKLNVS